MVVKLMYLFDEEEQIKQRATIEQGAPITRGSVLVFLPGMSSSSCPVCTLSHPSVVLSSLRLSSTEFFVCS